MSEPEPEQAEPGPSQKGLGRKLILALVLGVVVFAALSFYGDVQTLQEKLTEYSWSYFALGTALATFNYLIRFVRWDYYLRVLQVHGVPKLESARIFFAGFVMSVTPGKVGEVFKSLLLFEARGVSVAHTAPVVVAERLTDLFALVLLTAAGSLSFEGGWTIALGGAAVVGLVWLACAWRSLGLAMLSFCDKLPGIRRIAPRLREAYESLQLLVRPWPLLWATSMSLVAWGLEVVSLYVIARGFEGVALGAMESLFAYSAPTIVGALAMLPGGLGVTEAGMTGVLLELEPSLDAAAATGITMLVRIATLWYAVLLGLLALTWHRRAMARPS